MNTKVFTAWFAQWRKPLRNWMQAQNMVPNGDLDDIVQDVFVRLLKYSDDELVENPQGYLFRIAHNVASEWRERCCRRQPHRPEWLEDLIEDSDLTPEALEERADISRDTLAAIGRLPERQKRLVILHVHYGLTYRQIADREGLTYRVVLRDLTTAYDVLRVKLARDAA